MANLATGLAARLRPQQRDPWRAVLVVEPEAPVRQALMGNLRAWGFEPSEAESTERALEVLAARPEIFLVLVDLAVPSLGGMGLLEAIPRHGLDPEIVLMTEHLDPDLALSLLRSGAGDYVRKPLLADEVRLVVHRVHEHRMLREKALTLQLLEETKKVERNNLVEFMVGLANVIDAKSPYTQAHSDRVASHTRALCRRLSLREPDYEDFSFGAKLHDIGKVGIPDRILDSPGRLSPNERRIVMDHPRAGARILEPMLLMKPILPMVLHHHENWDGTGYPDGLEGESIPLGARIVRIADCYDAMTSRRPYREPLPVATAIEILRSEKGRSLDPELTAAFLDLVGSGRLTRNARQDQRP